MLELKALNWPLCFIKTLPVRDHEAKALSTTVENRPVIDQNQYECLSDSETTINVVDCKN